jgi:hypothetical protein
VPLSLAFISRPTRDTHPDLEHPGAASGAHRECVDVFTVLSNVAQLAPAENFQLRPDPSPFAIFSHPAYIQALDARRPRNQAGVPNAAERPERHSSLHTSSPRNVVTAGRATVGPAPLQQVEDVVLTGCST